MVLPSSQHFFLRTLVTTTLLILGTATGYASTIIAAVGDSITAGWPYRTSNGNGCYLSQSGCNVGYEKPLQAKLDDTLLRNYGDPGSYSSDARNTVSSLVGSTTPPEIVITMAGTNDLWGSSIYTVNANMTLAIDEAIKKDIPIVLGTIPPDTRGGANATKNIPGANQLLRDLAESRKIPLADHYVATSYSDWQNNKMSDGLHPNLSGYELMADVWYNAIQELNTVTSIVPILSILLL